jgi:cytochrome c oxidase subunit IV
MANYATDHNESGIESSKPQTAIIWKTFGILSALTAIEFVIAFLMPASNLKVAIFVGMTLVKAFYIVGEFMHLKHEVKSLIWAMIIPTLFIVWLLLALMTEGGSIFQLR